MLRLEKDLQLSAEDFIAMRTPSSHDPQDLAAYLDFLEDVGAFDWKKVEAKTYDEEFYL